jgi:tryptophan-rich sensory protein
VRELYKRYTPLFGVLLLIVVAFLIVLFRGGNTGQAVVGLSHLFLLAVVLLVGTARINPQDLSLPTEHHKRIG